MPDVVARPTSSPHLAHLSGPAVLLDHDGLIVAVNEAWELARLLGGGDPAVCGVGASYLDVCRRAGEETGEAATCADGLEEVLGGTRGAFGIDYACAIPGDPGRRCTVLVTAVEGGALVSHIELSRRGRASAGLSALCDSLTGLANRPMLLDRLHEAVTAGRRVGVLFLDLDDFKMVNDGLGHAAGDALLVEVARRLTTAVRPTDLVVRWGGDEFGVLCDDIADEADMLAVAGHVHDAFAAPFTVGGTTRSVTASVGCRHLVDAELTADEAVDALVRDADIAMYQAKTTGKDRVETFSSAIRERLAHSAGLERDLERAIEADELMVHYQPHVDLVTERVVGVEALLRWNHAERGAVSPSEFIPIAERSGLIVPLGDRVLERACSDLRAWHALGHSDLAMSVNVTVQQLAQPGFTARVLDCLEATGVRPDKLCLEVTESTLMETSSAGLTTLEQLRDAGVFVAIDDFGTGYSSLAYLKRLPVEVLKVDRAFVGGLGTDREDSAIVASVLSMAHAMGLHVIAEGVETRLQAEELMALGCTFAQGFLYSPAVTPERIPELVRAGDEPRRRCRSGRRGAARFTDEFLEQLGLHEASA